MRGARCYETRPCFAKSDFGSCSILTDTPPKGVRCSFCKRERLWTNGVYYPVNKNMTGEKKENQA